MELWLVIQYHWYGSRENSRVVSQILDTSRPTHNVTVSYAEQLFNRSYCMQSDRLLAEYCHLFVCLSLMLCIVTKWYILSKSSVWTSEQEMHWLKVKGLDIYIPPLTGKPRPAAVYNWSGVLTGNDSALLGTRWSNFWPLISTLSPWYQPYPPNSYPQNLEMLLIDYISFSWSRDHFVYVATNMGEYSYGGDRCFCGWVSMVVFFILPGLTRAYT